MDGYRILDSLCNNHSSNWVAGTCTDSYLREENDRKNVERKREKEEKRRGDRRMNGKRKQPSCSMEELNPCERMRMGRQPIEGCTGIFALRMRSFDVSLYPTKGCEYSLHVGFSSLRHTRVPHRNNGKNSAIV